MNRFFTKTLEVDVTFRVALDRDDVRERSRLPDVYRSPDVFRLPAKKIERGPHENRKINANLEITTPTTSYPMTLVGESKCRQAKQATLRFTNIHHTLFSSSPSAHDETNMDFSAPLSSLAPPLTLLHYFIIIN